MARAIRYSKKREAILTALQHTDQHPSAEWVYQALKPEFPDLSLGTVYRNLTFFQEQGLIKSLGVVNGQERFDATTAPHSHFICNGCGAVIDLDDFHLDDQFTQSIQKGRDLSVQKYELTFFGQCASCK